MAVCSDELIARVAELVRVGMVPARAAATAGVFHDEYAAWMARGARNGRGDYRYARFRTAVMIAEAECERTITVRIMNSARDTWQAAAWLAERRFPDRFVRRSVNDDEVQPPAPTGQADPFADVDDVIPLDRARRERDRA